MSPNHISTGNDYNMEKIVESELKEKEAELWKKRKDKLEECAEYYKVKENFFLTPVKHYLKYKKKKQEYKQLYEESRIKYYATIKVQLLWKMVRKQLFSKLIYNVGFAIAMFLLIKNTKPGAATKRYFESLYRRIIKYFKSLLK